MTVGHRIRFGDTVIEYEVRRSTRRKKTVQITVNGDGILVSAPLTLSDDVLRAIVRRRASWILRQPVKAMLPAVPKQFASGETLPYLGRNALLLRKTADVRSLAVRFDHWRFRVTVPQNLADAEQIPQIQRAFIAWYRARAEKRLPSSVERWRLQFGCRIKPRILIRSQRQRWGSCAHDGTLRFNWRVVMLEPALIEYIVVHELAHLTIRNHSPQFWDLVASVMPDVQYQRQRLKEIGPTLPL